MIRNYVKQSEKNRSTQHHESIYFIDEILFSFRFSFVGASCHASGPDYPLLGFKPERPFSFGSFKNLFTLLLLLKTMLTIVHQIGQMKNIAWGEEIKKRTKFPPLKISGTGLL